MAAAKTPLKLEKVVLTRQQLDKVRSNVASIFRDSVVRDLS